MDVKCFKSLSLPLSCILVISLFLNLYGLEWGLPSCWNVDQSVTTALNMLKNRTPFPQDYLHPALYYYVLVMFIAPYLTFQYFFNRDFSSFLEASKVSWNYMALNYPGIATGIFITARLSSVVFSLLTVFFVYKITKAVHNKKAGLFSALILALNMDFINWAHMEKSVALVNLLIVISMYYVILIYKEGFSLRNYSLFCIFSGLSISAKFNGGSTVFLIPVISLWKNFYTGGDIGLRRKLCGLLKTSIYGIIIYLLTFMITSPGILLKADKYYMESMGEYKHKMMPESLSSLSKMWFANACGIFERLTQMFGLPLFILVLGGLIYVLLRCRRMCYVFSILMYIPIVTVCLLIVSPRIYYWSVNSKFIVQMVPFLCIFGGIFCADFLDKRFLFSQKNLFKPLFIFAIFLISFFYCLDLDLIYKRKDLRYQVDRWILENIPRGSSIVVNNQLEYSSGINILKDYNVYILGDSPGTIGAYSFINGQYRNIKDMGEINGLRIAYVMRSCWKIKRTLVCSVLYAPDDSLQLLKTFERKKFWYWQPGMDGFEPDKIEIFVKK